MRILIVGGDGFVAFHNTKYLLERGIADEIILLDNQSRAGGRNISYLQTEFGEDKVINVKADIRDLSEIIPYFKDVDRVYHTAAQVTMTKSLENPVWDYGINSTGTINVLEAVRLKCSDAPVIYCSTNKVYGDIIKVDAHRKFNNSDYVVRNNKYTYSDELIEGITENGFHVGPEAANCPYGTSKMMGELSMRNYFDSYGIKTVRARMSCIYGTHQYGCEDQGWLSWFTIRTLLDEPITIFGDGMQVRDVLYGSDHARAFDLMAATPKCYGGAFNLGGGHDNTLSLLELLDLIEQFTGKRTDIKYSDWRHGDQRVYISDIMKLKEYTGWEPEVSVHDGVKKLIDWTAGNIKEIKKVISESS